MVGSVFLKCKHDGGKKCLHLMEVHGIKHTALNTSAVLFLGNSDSDKELNLAESDTLTRVMMEITAIHRFTQKSYCSIIP